MLPIFHGVMTKKIGIIKSSMPLDASPSVPRGLKEKAGFLPLGEGNG